MTKNIFVSLLFLSTCLIAQTNSSKIDYTKFVNPFIGTGSVDSLSLSGSNFPGATYPFGLVQLSPDTKDIPDNPCSGYDYNDSTIVGFTHTHLSGTGVSDLFDILFMPYGGDIKWEAGTEDGKIKGYRSTFSHKNEIAYPGYYSVLLDDYKIKAELTATEHCGMQKYTFPNDDPYHLIIDLNHSLDKKRPYWSCKIIDAQLKVIDDKTIEGYRIITGWANLRKVYFHAEFSKPFSSYTFKESNFQVVNGNIANGTNVKMAATFQNNNEPLLIKVGLSTVSLDGAKNNLHSEINDFDFDKVVSSTNKEWNNELSCINAEGTARQKKIFYTGLYHLFIQPNNLADVDGSYVDFNYNTQKIPGKKYYSTFSLWDTYRAAHPLYTIVQSKRTAGFINSFLDQYKEYGYLPIWQLWGRETYCMIGNHAIPVIADAFFKNIKGVDWNLAYEAVKMSSKTDHWGSPFNLLDKYGYFPETLQSQSVSITLEDAYDDWCVAEMANKLNQSNDYNYFANRSNDYKNLFDPKMGFFRAKDENGNWITPFNPLAYGGNGGSPFTEGNAWQYLWYVPQDVPSFIKLFGNKEKFIEKLDTFFTLEAKPENVNGNASGFIGQYAHGNEPSHHIVYLYDFAGEPWKAQYYSAKVMNELYTDEPSGYSGNEDCGQMSAWYIFSAMGFYPVNPANSIYCIGSPQLSEATINLRDGKKFKITANNVSHENIYIQKVILNGNPYDKTYITHKDIMNGGTLEFFMGSEPNKNWGKVTPPQIADYLIN